MNLIFSKESSTPSKVWWFRTLQIHQKRQAGTTPHTSQLLQVPTVPLQDSNKAKIECGMTQVIPTKQNKRDHNPLYDLFLKNAVCMGPVLISEIWKACT
jgi:hypothetical protein